VDQAANPPENPRRTALLRVTALVFAGALALGLLAGGMAAFVLPPAPATPPAPSVAGGPGLRGAMETFRLYDAPRSMPAVSFRDGNDQAVSLDDFRGRIVLLNLWATWCAPCIDEMPALERLQTALGGDAFTVVAVSIDRQGRRLVEPFLQRLNLSRLPVYLDPSGAVARSLGVPGLPTSVLIDRDGRELGRISGTAPWDGEAAANLIRFAAGLPRMPGLPTPATVPPPAVPGAQQAPDAAPGQPAPPPPQPRESAPPIERIPDVPGSDRAEAVQGGAS
jgi:thiol-disulfide isomerase/thioredoxin